MVLACVNAGSCHLLAALLTRYMSARVGGGREDLVRLEATRRSVRCGGVAIALGESSCLED